MKKTLGILAVTFALGVGMSFGQATPQDALKELEAAFRAGSVVKIAGGVPASYVKDVTGLVQDFAGKMDPELWNKLRETLGSASKVFATKAPILLDFMSDEDKPVDAATKAQQVKTLIAGMGDLEKLVKSDVSSLDYLKKVESAAFLKEVDKLFASTRKAAKELPDSETVKVLARVAKKTEKLENGDIRLFFTYEDVDEDEDDEEIDFRKVEGRWIPVKMADDWAKDIKEARDSIAKLDFTSPEGKASKAQFMMVLGMLDPMIQQISQVENAKQLQETFGGVLFPLMMMGVLPGTTPGVLPGTP